MTGARALVTGAGGFVGSAIASGLAALGWQVTAVDRSFDADARVLLARADLVTAELGTNDRPPLPDADLVIHAAALTTDPADLGINAADHVAANMVPLLTLLCHAARHPPAAFVFLSSSGVFAPGDGAPDLTDDLMPTGTAPYAAAKRAGEVLVPSALSGVCAAHVLRLGHLYGPAERPRATRNRVSLPAGLIDAARTGKPAVLRTDDPRRDWTLTTDLAPALIRLVAAPEAGRVLHFGSPHIRHDNDMVALVPGAAITRAPSPAAKPPMIASRIPALTGFDWTAPETAVPALIARGVAA